MPCSGSEWHLYNLTRGSRHAGQTLSSDVLTSFFEFSQCKRSSEVPLVLSVTVASRERRRNATPSPPAFHVRAELVWCLSEAAFGCRGQSQGWSSARDGGCRSHHRAELCGTCLEKVVLGEKDGKPFTTSLSPGPDLLSLKHLVIISQHQPNLFWCGA